MKEVKKYRVEDGTATYYNCKSGKLKKGTEDWVFLLHCFTIKHGIFLGGGPLFDFGFEGSFLELGSREFFEFCAGNPA